MKGTGSGSVPVLNPALVSTCDPNATKGPTVLTSNGGILNGSNTVSDSCDAATIGYSAGSISSDTNVFTSSNAYYVTAGPGTLPNVGRNTLPINPINNFDVTANKSFSFRERYKFTIGAQAYNVLNHAQYLPGAVNNVYATSYVNSYNFQTVSSGLFNQPNKEFNNNARTMQLTAKFAF